MEFDSFTLVLLRRPADAPDLPDEELDRIQAEHLAYMEAQRRSGTLLANGPFRDQDDVAVRGACVFALELEEARAVLAGRNFAAAVDAEWQRAGELRITAVPTHLCAGKRLAGFSSYEDFVHLIGKG